MTTRHDEWLSIDEAATAFRVHPSTVRERIRRKEYPAHLLQLSPGRWRMHCSLVYPTTAQITQLPAPAITDAQLDAAIDRAIARFIDRFLGDALMRKAS